MPFNERAAAINKAIQWAKSKIGVKYGSPPYAGYGYYPGDPFKISPNGEKYVCATFVCYALLCGGFDLGNKVAPLVGDSNKPDRWTDERYIQALLSHHGFKKYAYNKNTLQKGDILIRDAYHTEIYIGNGEVIGAANPTAGCRKTTLAAFGANYWSYFLRCVEFNKNKYFDQSFATQYNWIEKVGQRVQYLLDADMENNAICFYITAKSYGWSDVSIAAVLGNMEKESTINPGAQNFDEMYTDKPTDYGIGLIQWTNERHNSMVDWVKSNYNYWYNGEGQTAYLRKELSETRWTVGNGILASMLPEEYRFNNGIDAMTCNTWTLEQATAWFFQCVEYVAIIKNNTTWNAHFPDRYENAQKWYTFITGLSIEDLILGGSIADKGKKRATNNMFYYLYANKKLPNINIYL